jgi:hypothetical protein
MRTMSYFDIFRYPLRAEEVLNYLHVNGTTVAEVRMCLDDLTAKQRVFRFGDLYSLHEDEQNIERRLKGNREAARWLSVARKRATLIGRFPFVRAVMASGSLSKDYMDENSDLDFFVVTAPGRLWIARTLLVLYKRVFLSNSHKMFCVNYFVDTQHLEIEEKNLFTATELATLIPLVNAQCYHDLLDANSWLRRFLPNYRRKDAQLNRIYRPLFTRFLEFMFNPVALPLDRYCMRMSAQRWKKLYEKKYDGKQFDHAFKTRKHVSKNHPNNYQKKILDLYRLKTIEYPLPGGHYD